MPSKSTHTRRKQTIRICNWVPLTLNSLALAAVVFVCFSCMFFRCFYCVSDLLFRLDFVQRVCAKVFYFLRPERNYYEQKSKIRIGVSHTIFFSYIYSQQHQAHAISFRRLCGRWLRYDIFACKWIQTIETHAHSEKLTRLTEWKSKDELNVLFHLTQIYSTRAESVISVCSLLLLSLLLVHRHRRERWRQRERPRGRTREKHNNVTRRRSWMCAWLGVCVRVCAAVLRVTHV